jgi:hypothetical protein
MGNMAETRKNRRTVNVFWWIKLRADLLVLLYRHNRLGEAIKLMDSLKIDVKTFNDTFY